MSDFDNFFINKNTIIFSFSSLLFLIILYTENFENTNKYKWNTKHD